MNKQTSAINRRQFLSACGVGLTAGVLPGALNAAAMTVKLKKQPNFLFLFADDLSFHALGALDNPDVRTPNLDRLVKEGVTFTHCFNQGSFLPAVCVASRAMLQTGRSLWRCGGADCGDWPLWGETLGKAGYDTFMTGKWHNRDNALHRSFKTVGPYGGGMYPSIDPNAEEHKQQGIVKDPYDRPRPGNSWTPEDQSLKGHWLKDDEKIVHSSVRWADAAIDYLKTASDMANPFFMYVAFHAPHDPRQAPKEYQAMYPPESLTIPPNLWPEHPIVKGDDRCRDELLAPFPRTEEAIRVHLSEYYAIITHMDHQIGRILDALRASGKADETVIIFSADQGLAVGQHGLMGKQDMYDHSIRMPLMMSGPGLKSGKTIDAMVYLQSMFATTCKMADIPVPETVEFPSLVPLLKGKKKILYDSIYGAYRDTQRMVRTPRYKLIRYPQVQQTQLFDLQKDPWETINLADRPEYQKVIKELDEQLRAWMKKTDDPLTLPPLE